MKKTLLFLLLSIPIFAQNIPKREFRSAWIATVGNIDFPSKKGLSVADQQAEFVAILNHHQKAGINTVVVQIRPTADALYESAFEPYSEVLTGKQGQNPGYDPLKFMIEECRKRSIEFHAWFNPYRVVSDVKTAKIDSSKNIAAVKPQWLLAYGNLRILDPGLPDSRNYVTKIVMDVVRRYDIDGVHFDDYFYPYPVTGQTLDDATTYALHNRNIGNRADWRRSNVDLLIKQVSDSIKAVKPYVKFGISPFGIWQNKTSNQPHGSDTKGLQSFSDIYADSKKWIQEGWVDYLAPQLYWYIGYSIADYQILANWWNQQANGRHIYIGQAIYRVNADANWDASQVPRQIRLNRSLSNIYGGIFYNTNTFMKNPLGVRDSVQNNYFKYPALPPLMAWKDNVAPKSPENLVIEAKPTENLLTWKIAEETNEMNKVRNFVLYKFEASEKIDTENPTKILAILPHTIWHFSDKITSQNQPFQYVVTALDRLGNESLPSNRVQPIIVTQTENQEPVARLFQNYPNPFSTETMIEYELRKSGNVSVFLLDESGKLIKNILNEAQTIGNYRYVLGSQDLRDKIYLLVLVVDNQRFVRKILIQ